MNRIIEATTISLTEWYNVLRAYLWVFLRVVTGSIEIVTIDQLHWTTHPILNESVQEVRWKMVLSGKKVSEAFGYPDDKIREIMKQWDDAYQGTHTFGNGYRVSVVTGEMFYTSPGSPFELMVTEGEINFGDNFIPDNPAGHLDKKEVNVILRKIALLPPRQLQEGLANE